MASLQDLAEAFILPEEDKTRTETLDRTHKTSNDNVDGWFFALRAVQVARRPRSRVTIVL